MIKKISEYLGEFWFIGGEAIGADGDVSDTNHAGMVMESLLQDLIEEVNSEFGSDLRENACYDEVDEVVTNHLDELNLLDEVDSVEQYIVDTTGFSQEKLDVIQDRVDPRDYGLKNLGWKRVKGTEIQTYTLTSEDLADITRGLYDAYDDKAEEMSYNIEVVSTNKYYTSVPFEVISGKKMNELRNFQHLGRKIKKYSSLHKAVAVASLPQNVIDAFVATGTAQRGLPEAAMLKVQHIYRGGVLHPVVEHTGDILHRMTHMIPWFPKSSQRTGWEYVAKKVRIVLSDLRSPYGFEKDMNENILSNAKYHSLDPKILKQKITEALLNYAKEHSKLKVYNRAQYCAEQACIAIGEQDFKLAVRFLEVLEDHTADANTWDKFASEYQLAPDGTILQYP